MQDLRQSTAVVIPFGPAVDKTDGVTLETGLVSALDHASTGIKLSKNGGAITIRHATVTASTYDGYGNYLVTLDATDTDTLKRLRVQYTDAATLVPLWQDFNVLPAEVFDAKYEVVGAIPTLGIFDRGTLQSLPSTTTSTIRAAAAFGDNTLVGCVLSVLGGTLAPYWQSVLITSNVGATDVLTHPAFAVTPTGTCLYTITGTPQSNPALTVAATIASGGITTASFAAGAIDAAAIAANAIGASELATDAVTEIANASVEAQITALMTYNRSANTTATITGPTSGSNALTVTVDAAYEPIKTL